MVRDLSVNGVDGNSQRQHCMCAAYSHPKRRATEKLFEWLMLLVDVVMRHLSQAAEAGKG